MLMEHTSELTKFRRHAPSMRQLARRRPLVRTRSPRSGHGAARLGLHRIFVQKSRQRGTLRARNRTRILRLMDAQYQLAHLDDEALLVNLKRFVAGANQLTALVLAHLAEVDARSAYRLWACPTLQAYCEYELRLSEDEAQRRCRAARVARQFPLLFEMLADGSIHLTGILLLAPHLTDENHTHLLACARYRRKREIEQLVAEIAPRADVPAGVEPLGSSGAPGAHSGSPGTWAAWAERRAVRELTPGDGPTQAPSAPPDWVATLTVASQLAEKVDPHPAAPARNASMRYKVQFTADQTYVDLLERARDLLSHQIPDRDLVRVQQLALEALVEKLSRRKFGASGAPRSAPPSTPSTVETPRPADPPRHSPLPVATTLDISPNTPAPQPRTSSASSASSVHETSCTARDSTITPIPTQAPRTRERHLPAWLRRAVWQRDQARCTYVDARGVRCCATSVLEFHHEHAHALGGAASIDNIKLRCRPHNALAAEMDFGRAFMERKKADASTGRAVANEIQRSKKAADARHDVS
jgi:5-methylcytosine-specific restriction endonuclease McrA